MESSRREILYNCDNTFTATTSSPLGNFVIQACDSGVHSVSLAEEIRDKNFQPYPEERVRVLKSDVENGKDHKILNACVRWLDDYFHNPKNLPNLEILICSNSNAPPFFRQSLEQLPIIAPFGKTVTYTDLARAAGNEKASRAAGGAMRNNPLLLLVPCHRVIPASGKLGKFSGGTRQRVKKWLLSHEGHNQF